MAAAVAAGAKASSDGERPRVAVGTGAAEAKSGNTIGATAAAFEESDPESVLRMSHDLQNIVIQTRMSEAARVALAKPARLRNDDDLKAIYTLASTMGEFNSRPEYNRRRLCRVFTYHRYNKGDVVFEEGDPPDGYYFILSGSVIGSKKSEDSAVGSMQGNYSQDMFTIQEGKGFGEGAMLRDEATNRFRPGGTRGATITCDQTTEFLKVELEDYIDVLGYSLQQELDEKISFLGGLPLLQGWSADALRVLAECVQVHTMSTNKVIFSQGIDEGVNFYIIRSGTVRIVMEMEVPEVRSINRGFKDVDRVEETRVRWLHVNTLRAGDFFGELAIMNNSHRSASAICESKSVLFVLPKGEFTKQITPNASALRYMRKVQQNYPDNETILRAYRRQREWQRYKKALVRSVLNTVDKTKELRVYQGFPYTSLRESNRRAKEARKRRAAVAAATPAARDPVAAVAAGTSGAAIGGSRRQQRRRIPGLPGVGGRRGGEGDATTAGLGQRGLVGVGRSRRRPGGGAEPTGGGNAYGGGDRGGASGRPGTAAERRRGGTPGVGPRRRFQQSAPISAAHLSGRVTSRRPLWK